MKAAGRTSPAARILIIIAFLPSPRRHWYLYPVAALFQSPVERTLLFFFVWNFAGVVLKGRIGWRARPEQGEDDDESAGRKALSGLMERVSSRCARAGV